MSQPLIIFFDPFGIGGAIKGFFSKIVETVIKQFNDLIQGGIENFMQFIYKGFLSVDTFGVGGPDSNPFDGSGSFINVANWANLHVLWLSGAVATISIAIAGGRMLWNYAHGYHEGLKAILSGLTIMVIVNLLVIQAVRVAVWMGDRYTEWILDQANYHGGKSWSDDLGSSGISLILLLMVGGLVLLSMLVQFILMVFRSAVLVLLAGTIVLPASAATTETGRKWLNKYISWMLAFICMKPAAATVYAVAFELLNTQNGKGFWDKATAAMAGMVLLGAAVFVMPAMLRLLTPVGVAIGGAMSGGGDSGSSGGSPAQQADGSSEPAAPRGSQASSGSGGGGIEGGPNGASSAEGGASKMATGGMGSGGMGSGGAAAEGGGAAMEGASVAAAPETAGASLAVGAAVGAAEAGKQAFQDAVTQGAEEAGGHDGSQGPVGGAGGGVDLG